MGIHSLRTRARRGGEDRLVMYGTQVGRPIGGERVAAISNLVVRLVSEYTAPGPTKPRIYLNDDVINVVLQDTLTKGELRLVQDGESEMVISTRLPFLQTMREDLIAGIEEITGRKVRVSANHMEPVEPDIAVETFVLDQRSGGGQAVDARQADGAAMS
jgi:uncharacterized protein YbcI